jgi:hypothetical protein
MNALGHQTRKPGRRSIRRDRFPASVINFHRRLHKTGKFVAVKAGYCLAGGQMYFSASVAMPQFDPVV